MTVSLSCALGGFGVCLFFFDLSLLLLRSYLYAELLISIASTLVLVNDSQSKRAEVVSRSSIYLERVQFFDRFGEGYIITVRVQGDLPNLEPLYQFFSEKFPRATLKVKQTYAIFQVHVW